MRLIDADTLIKELHYALDGSGFDEDYRDMGIDDIINNQPTAFNVEKVVEQLEKHKEVYSPVVQDGYFKGKVAGLGDAIQIVKRGGVNDD